IPPAPRGIPQIEVSFDIDANGILNVNARDLGTGKEQRITIASSSGLSKDEVEKMQKEAERFSEEDKKTRELAEARNQADQLIYTTEKTLKEYGDKISQSDREAVIRALDRLKSLKDSDNLNELRKGLEELTAASHKLAQAMYEAASRARATESGPSTEPKTEKAKKGKGEGEVIDADYEVKD
ncbi:MAG TPA: Hsp70 family protein, partial [Candidatus Hypogeohydataceae bacterium YC40]